MDNEIKKIFDQVVADMDEVTQEEVNQACSELQADARKNPELGEGVYIKGLINTDKGGVSLRFKVPARGIRIEHFVESDKVPKKVLMKRESSPDPEVTPGSDLSRQDQAKALAEGYEGSDLTGEGLPQVASLNRDMPDGPDWTAAERDEVFKD